MTDTFTWTLTGSPAGVTTLRTRTAQFGDGYCQQVPDGINNATDLWPLTFTGTKEYCAPILAFLKAKAGATSFYWTPPLGTQGLFRCSGPTLTPLGGGAYQIDAPFQQVYAP